MTSEVELSRADLVGLLRAYYEARAERDVHDRAVKRMGDLLKDYLENNPEEVLYDEAGYEASLQSRRGSGSWDTKSMDQELILRLWKANALDVNGVVLKALDGREALKLDCDPFFMPGGESHALIVKKVER